MFISARDHALPTEKATPQERAPVAIRPAHGTPEWNAIFDAHRKALGYPSRQEIAAFDRRFPAINATATGGDQ